MLSFHVKIVQTDGGRNCHPEVKQFCPKADIQTDNGKTICLRSFDAGA